jgi:hypothetical protein
VRKIYRVLALLIALEVVVQAAALALAFSGLAHWVEGGGVVDGGALEGDSHPFPEVAALFVHGINGSIVVPALALLLFVASFFAGVPRGVAWSGGVLAIVIVQVMLGFSAADVPALGALHGINALLLFVVALLAARRARPRPAVPDQERTATAETGV